jgi:hypothetical protein
MVKANCAVKLAFDTSWVGSIALVLLALVPWFLAFPDVCNTRRVRDICAIATFGMKAAEIIHIESSSR